jgi:hypothetical protein
MLDGRDWRPSLALAWETRACEFQSSETVGEEGNGYCCARD